MNQTNLRKVSRSFLLRQKQERNAGDLLSMKSSDAKDQILQILTIHHVFWMREAPSTSGVLLKLLTVGSHVSAVGCGKEMCSHEDKHSSEKL